MANVTITQLPAAGPITGTESVPIVQNGQTVQTTTGAIAASPSQQQTFLTLNNEPSLPNSRYLSTGTGLGLTDGGAQSDLEIILNGASGSLEAAGNGVVVKTGGTTVTARTITTSGAGLTITNGNGVSGNPTIALSGLAASLANMGGTGVLGVVSGSSITSFVITGTANQIDVANGAGPGNPTISISTNPIIPGTGAMTIPKGTTAQRPGGVDGMIRFNTETSAYETFDTTGGWSTLPSGAVTFVGTGTGLTGGPITSSGTISIANTTVAAGSYGSASSVGTFTVNAQGQLTVAANASIAISTSQVTSGVFEFDRGGTGVSTYVQGDILYYDFGTTLSRLPVGTANYLLVSSGTTPIYVDPATVTVGTASLALEASNIAGGNTNNIPYQTAVDTTGFIIAPSIASTFLSWDGVGFVWDVVPQGTVTSVDIDPDTTGLTFAGGPITSSGVFTVGGTLAVLHGGTGAADASTARLNLSAAESGANTDITSIALTTGTISTTPMSANDIAPKSYVDAVAEGLHIHAPCAAATTDTLANLTGGTVTYNNGTGGVGATLTLSNALTTLDTTYTLQNGDRVMVKNEVNAAHNGIYTWATGGTVLTRATDYDTPTEMAGGDFTFVQNGTLYADTGWVQVDAVAIVGTDPVNFVQFSGAGTYTAGTGLTLVGTQFSLVTPVAAANGGTGISSFGVGDLLFANTTTTLDKLPIGTSTYILTSNGTAPAYTDPATITVGTATSATSATTASNVGGGGAGQIVYNTGSSTTTFLALGTSTYLLRAGASAPEYVDPATVTVGTATNATSATAATNVAGGGAGQIVYNTAAGTTTFLSLGTLGYILTAGATAPQYTDPATITVGTATNATDATNADNVAVSASSVNATFYPTFVDATSGDQAIEVDTDLTYNPSTNTLTVPNLVATTGISGGTF